ncbi:MAG: hypothetical protein O8C66_04305 [Candidatus Methanoperedens sp.]|nr:hypothetical protein [Candidatus Methanoperedens sp.]MCZ7369710.1 hypothetical protein [Candidatus Methanoperedens sp.]
MRSKLDTLNRKEGKKFLDKELESCMEVDYAFSKITDTNVQKEIIIPALLLKENLKNKDRYLDVTMHSRWSSINGDMNEHEAWMFLDIDFENLGILKFKFNLFDARARRWIETLILADGKAVLCDKNEETNFAVGLSNIPLDIPLIQMALTAFFLARKKSFVGG